MKINDVLSITAGRSKQVTTAAATANVALPTPLRGPLRYVLIVADGPCYIDFGPSGVVAVPATSIALVPFEPMIFNVQGHANIASIDSVADTLVLIQVSPLENG